METISFQYVKIIPQSGEKNTVGLKAGLQGKCYMSVTTVEGQKTATKTSRSCHAQENVS